MSELMAVLLDGVAQLEYDRDKALPPQQELYLEKMDSKMAEGIDIAGEWITEPSSGQRAQFVAANLASALKSGDEAVAAAMCSYLAIRYDDLKQVRISSEGGGMNIELDYEQPYRKQAAVQFQSIH